MAARWRFSPCFPVTDLRRALDHYATLGFDVRAWNDGDEYGIAEREGVQLHLGLPGERGGSCTAYLYVEDADALAAEWAEAAAGGETHPPEDTPWGMREGAHVDLDGNVIRFGSPLR